MKQIIVSGMSCAHCQNAVKSALEELGLENVSVNLDSGAATFHEADISIDSVREAIDDAGFEVVSAE